MKSEIGKFREVAAFFGINFSRKSKQISTKSAKIVTKFEKNVNFFLRIGRTILPENSKISESLSISNIENAKQFDLNLLKY